MIPVPAHPDAVLARRQMAMARRPSAGISISIWGKPNIESMMPLNVSKSDAAQRCPKVIAANLSSNTNNASQSIGAHREITRQNRTATGKSDSGCSKAVVTKKIGDICEDRKFPPITSGLVIGQSWALLASQANHPELSPAPRR